ncbi:MAG: S8 family peptidase, partial [Salinivirgaceae bacterium]|nr:S8 family peptidase [Salinivirgaceae bacterium]
NSKYGASTGTSAAAPVISGAAALIWSARPSMTATQIAELIRVTADVIDTIPDNMRYRGKMGSGRLNVLKAMTDSSLPSIRITDYNFTAENDKFVSDAKISLNINVINHLKPAKNVVITLEADLDKAITDSVVWSIDSIGTNEIKSSPTFTATLSNQLLDNEIVPFYVKVKADGYEAEQVLEITVNPTFIDVKWGIMETTIANNGKIGIYNFDGQLGKGILYQGFKKLMSDGALMLALDSLTIASSFQNDNQFKCTSKPELSEDENIKRITCSLSPTDISGIKIEQEFVFDENLPSAMICNYLISSTRQAEYDNAAVGLYFDWDIVNSLTNVISYDAARKLAYIYNTGTTNLYAGVCLLTKGNAVPYAFELSANGGSTLITDAFTDEQKWLAMNYARPQSFSTNIDLAMMMSCNNIKLQQGDTANVRFALIAAENLYELQKTAELAAELYCEKEEDEQPIINCISDNHNNVRIYPNPAASQINIECDAPINLVRIYCPDGTLELSENGNKTNSILLDISNIPHGLHIFEITCAGNRKMHRIIECGF